MALIHNLKSEVMTKLNNQISPVRNLFRCLLCEKKADVKLLDLRFV